MQHIKFTTEAIPKIYETLLTTNSFSASDGSVLRNEGSYGYIITTRDERWKIEGMGLVPLTTTDQYPQRAEFYGGFALASLLKVFYIWGGRKPLSLRTWIDNEAVTTNNSAPPKTIGLKNFLTDDYDLWEMTQQTLKNTKCKIHWTWIKGHQDRDTKYEDLPFEAQLNVQVNDLAEAAHKQLSIAPPYRTLDLPITVYINNQVASHSNMRRSIQNAAHSDDLIEYMSQKYKWTTQTKRTIDWDLFAYCYSKKQIHDMTNIIKYIHGWQFTKEKENQQNPNASSTCPIGCGEVETQLHFLTCKDPTWIKTLNLEKSKLKQKLSTLHTAPVIISILSFAFENNYSTHTLNTPTPISRNESIAYMAAVEQQSIGWKNFLQGRLSKKWAIAQHYYFKETYKSVPIPSGYYESWKKNFIPTLINFGLELWNLRNDQSHGKTPQEMAQIRRKKLNKEILRKYRQGSKSVSPPQRRLFQKPLKLRIYDSNHSKQNWLTAVEIAQQARKRQMDLLYKKYPRLSSFNGFTHKVIPSTKSKITQTPRDKTPPRKTKYIQKTIRELFLNAVPSVRFRQNR